MLALMLFAGFAPQRWPVRFCNGAAIGLVALFAARMVILVIAWSAHNTDLVALRQALRPVQPGQTIYVAEADVEEAPAYWQADTGWRRLSDGFRMDEHDAAIALIENRAYWPFEFDIPSQQPIRTRPSYRDLAGQFSHMPNRADAAVADVCGFDYVLLLEADSVPDLPADRFRLLVQAGFASLYGITRCKEAP